MSKLYLDALMLMDKNVNCFILAGAVFVYCFSTQTLAQEQITSDGTVSTKVETVDNLNFTITGGTQKGNNLFHSFSYFSIPDRGLAAFKNSDNIQNIISRVTGESISNIEGSIKAQGNANLLLINPNGIIFGSNARLYIGGSFLATTADSIHFADGTQFAVKDTQTTPLLTVTAPIGLGFGKTPGSIESRSIKKNSNGLPIDGLTVKTGKTFTLVGGEVLIDDGLLRAPGGRIELGSVDSFSFVSLNLVGEGWTLGYETVDNFQNIHLSQTTIGTNDASASMPNGDIKLQGKAITVTNDSKIQGFNFGTNPGGTLSLYASNIVEVTNGSSLSTSTLFSGAAGEIKITTGRLLISDNSSIDTTSEDVFGLVNIGNGGNLTIDASESIEIRNESSLLATRTLTDGKAGDINLITERLILSDGGQVSSSTFREGKGGNITVNAFESIEIDGRSNNLSNESGNGLLSQTSGEFATGNGGDIQIITRRLNVQEGGRISVGAVNGSEGKAGTLNINASESININGFGSTLLAESKSSQPAGDLTINTARLTVVNGGEVNVSATGTGEAGSLNIDAQDITLDRGTLNAETNAGDKGNITISNADTLLLRNNSKITTNATQLATGGDITITSKGIALIDNSNITADAVEGRGGDIQITTQRLFQEPGSQITATSEQNIDGTITINSDIDSTSGLFDLPSVIIDAEAIFAQNLCRFEDGKIAKGSSFIITGRGGFTPTAKDSLGDRDRVVGWANRDDLKVSKNGLVAVRQNPARETLEKHDLAPSEALRDRVIQQAQGWIVTSDGSVWLTAENPRVTLQNSGVLHPDCGNSPVK